MNYSVQVKDRTLEKVQTGLQERNFEPIVVTNREEALAKIKELIPQGASVMNGSSWTLQEIGFTDYLKSNEHGWNNLHEAIVVEKDRSKQMGLRMKALSADYYLGSAHALTEDGELLIVSNTGSQLPHLAFTSPNVILVIGIQKIVPDMAAGFERLKKEVLPLEDEHILKAYGVHTVWAKTLILHRENPMLGRKVKIILVQEKLGF